MRVITPPALPDPPGGRRKLPPRLLVILVLRGVSYVTTIAGATTLLILGQPLEVVVAFATVIALGGARAARHLTAGLTPPRPHRTDRGQISLVLSGLVSLIARTRIVVISVTQPGNGLLLRIAK